MKVLLFDNKNECPLWWINFLTDLIDNYSGGWYGGKIQVLLYKMN